MPSLKPLVEWATQEQLRRNREEVAVNDWATKIMNADGSVGGYRVDIPSLLFTIQLTELCAAGCLNKCGEDGVDYSQSQLIDQWKAEIANLRQCERMLVVRACYHLFYNGKDDRRDTFGDRWRAAHGYVKYLFTVDLETAWDHLTDPLRYELRMRFESCKMFHKPEPTVDEVKAILTRWYMGVVKNG